jgi:hypothetical protein
VLIAITHSSRELVVVVDGANLQEMEILPHVLEIHPEGTIIRMIVVVSLLKFIGPFGRAIRPRTIPLEVTPRITKLDDGS